MALKARIRIRRTPPAELGPMLAAARERTGHTQARVSIAAGLGRSYVCLIEGGHRTPSRVAAERLAAVLQLTDAERELLYAAAVSDAGLSHPARTRVA
ncbi:helix-turn-helix domain-containing protein [Streptomyces sp. ISL-112]|uniref:helix-turn-helix domain-containing protein n=1 Tax=unclassified Streptomyces TaxID=2593676 RepID=UPI001BEA0FBB|nr:MULTISPECIES: helix-turn-helix transcriptional regulator [unclassified Streptomyces]MBT2425232.1 helix-turn-helix domain-containing protein [Streptomyces sp. ISL-112]MBT2462023.1 helix-turn-helix domain-containing protein [Streptomyces sp. ISL-63]